MERPINQQISSPKPSFFDVVVPFIILNNNSFHPVVLLVNNLICIFMIILEQVSKGGEITKETDFIPKSYLLHLIILLAHLSRRLTR